MQTKRIIGPLFAVISGATGSAAMPQVQGRPPLELHGPSGAPVLEEDFAAPLFRVVLIADLAAWDTAEDELEGARGWLHDWVQEHGGWLEAIEVVIAPEEDPASALEVARGYLRVTVHAADNQRALEDWRSDDPATLWIVGPGGSDLGSFPVSHGLNWAPASWQLEYFLSSYMGLETPSLWGQVVAAESSWRLATRALVQSRRVSAVDSLLGMVAELHAVAPDDIEAGAARVQLASLLLLAARDGAEFPRDLLEDLRRAKLYRKSPHLRIADACLRRAVGELDGEKFLKEVLPRKRDDLLEHLVALRQLRLRGSDLADGALAAALRAGGKDWEVRSVAFRFLADQAEDGIHLLGDRLPAPESRPVVDRIEKERSWQLRLAYAEALPTYPVRSSVEDLVSLLESEAHPRVVEGVLASLLSLSGMKFGARPDKWKRWLGDLDGDWRPRAPVPGYWEASGSRWGLSQLEASPIRSATPEGSIFETDLQRVLFVVDTSESMRDGLAREVDQQLERQFEFFSADASLGMVVFAVEPKIVGRTPKLRAATRSVKKDLHQSFVNQPKEGRTDMAASLRTAFEFPEVEEIFLVTDGYPTEGHPLTSPSLVALADDLNAVQRVRINTVLFRVAGSYMIEDLKGKPLPEPTAEERREWAKMVEGMSFVPDLSLLHALAAYNEGRCQVAFGNQIYSRDGPPPVD